MSNDTCKKRELGRGDGQRGKKMTKNFPKVKNMSFHIIISINPKQDKIFKSKQKNDYL